MIRFELHEGIGYGRISHEDGADVLRDDAIDTEWRGLCHAIRERRVSEEGFADSYNITVAEVGGEEAQHLRQLIVDAEAARLERLKAAEARTEAVQAQVEQALSGTLPEGWTKASDGWYVSPRVARTCHERHANDQRITDMICVCPPQAGGPGILATCV